MRRHLGGRGDAGRLRAAHGLDRLPCRHVEDVERPRLVGGEREIALDHHRLGHGRVPSQPELRRDLPLVHVPVAGEGRLLAVHGERPPGDRAVLQRAAQQARRRDGPSVVCETRCAALGELPHLGELGTREPLRDRGKKPDPHLRLGGRGVDQRTEDRGRVDDRLRVWHREHRAVAASSRRGGPGRDRLLVLATRRPQVHVGIDEGRGEHEAVAVDDAVAVRVDGRPELGDDAIVDANVEPAVDALDRIEHPRAADDEVVLAAIPSEQHHATSSATAAATGTGPCVSRS